VALKENVEKDNAQQIMLLLQVTVNLPTDESYQQTTFYDAREYSNALVVVMHVTLCRVYAQISAAARSTQHAETRL
jgi:hypothetical protein